MKRRKLVTFSDRLILASDLDGNSLIKAYNAEDIPLDSTVEADHLNLGAVVFCKLGNDQFKTGRFYELVSKTYDSFDGPVHYNWEHAELTENGVPGLFLQKATTKTFEEGVKYYERDLDTFTPITPAIGGYVSSNTYEDSVHYRIIQNELRHIQNVMLWWCDPINIVSSDLNKACIWSKTQVIRIPANIITREELDSLIESTEPINIGVVVGSSTKRDQYAFDPNKNTPCFMDTIPCSESGFSKVYYVLSAVSRYNVCHHELVVEVKVA